MARPPAAWHPTPDEVERIVTEMRPIIQEFARRARQAERSQETAGTAGR